MAMKDPENYVQSNMSNRNLIIKTLNNIKKLLHWKENEIVLDIGCGPGDLTSELLYPILPENAKITSVDISKEMINYAKSYFSKDRITYQILDITDNGLFSTLNQQQFTKIFALNILQRMEQHNLRQVYSNLYDLLLFGGDLIAVIPNFRGLLNALYQGSIKSKKFEKYSEELTNAVINRNLFYECINCLEETGFEIMYFDKLFNFTFSSYDLCCQFLRSVHNFDNFSKELADLMKIEFINIYEREEILKKEPDSRYTLHYDSAMFLARKPFK